MLASFSDVSKSSHNSSHIQPLSHSEKRSVTIQQTAVNETVVKFQTGATT